MKTGLPADRAARLAAQTVFDRPLLLEAGAGTGKTTTLVARILCWALGEGWDRVGLEMEGSGAGDLSEEAIAAETLQGIVAITFTEAAAAEMAERLAASLAQIVDGNESKVIGFDAANLPASVGTETRRRRAIRLLESFDYLTVSTIHAFCYGILKCYPLEAGLHPDLRVDADGRELEVVGRMAVEHWAQDAYTAGEDTPFLALAAGGIGPGRLLEAVMLWIAEGPTLEILEMDPLSPEAVGEFLDSLSDRAADVLGFLGERLHDLRKDRVACQVEGALLETVEILAEVGPRDASELPAQLTRLQDLWPENRSDRIRHWGRGQLDSAEERARLEGLGAPFFTACEAFAAAIRTAGALDPALLAAAREALLPLLRQVETELRHRGVITFSGLLRETLALLEGSPSVLERERRRIRLLLVDEFQDTDPLQSEIVERLALGGPVETRPSLFVVGDPKQSIYAWRDADLAAYERFEQALLAEGGARHSLELNFRSTPPILAEVDRVISPVMRYEHGIQPRFRGLTPQPDRKSNTTFRDGRWRPIEYWVSWGPDPETGRLGPGSPTEAQEVEAYELANDIRRLHDVAGVPWKRIGVLFRKSGSQPAFLDEMRRYDIPFAVTRDRNYYQRREVIEAAAWVRATINPTDHLALLTVLRSIVVGVPDAALIPLWSKSFPEFVTELGGPRDHGMEAMRALVYEASAATSPEVPGLERLAGWEESLVAALSALGRLRDSYRRDPADVFVRALRRELLVEISEAARFQGKFRLANLHRFFRQLEAAMESDEADVHAILRALRLGVMEAREAEEALPRDAAEEAVQVMTVHTAKGLEFDHVYVAQLHAGTRTGGNRLLEAAEVETGDWQYHLFGAQTLGYERAEARRVRIEAAEMVRTLYVAMTRACERVVLIGTWPERPEPIDPVRARNYVELLQSRRELPGSLSEPANDPQVQLLGHWDQEDIRWRFLGGARTHRSRRHSSRAPDWLPTGERVAELARKYDQRLGLAHEWMQRPFTEAVSTDVSSRLEEAAADFSAEGEGHRAAGGAARRQAREVGTAVHDCLEHWRLEADVEGELERQRRRLGDLPGASSDVIAAAGEVLERFVSSELYAELLRVAPHALGREIPVLVTPGGDDQGPVGCYSGAIDLLYRDPASGEPVVVDFKTDRIEDPLELERRTEVYHLQEERYGRAVQEALGLERPPRTELWFLWTGRIVASQTEAQ